MLTLARIGAGASNGPKLFHRDTNDRQQVGFRRLFGIYLEFETIGMATSPLNMQQLTFSVVLAATSFALLGGMALLLYRQLTGTLLGFWQLQVKCAAVALPLSLAFEAAILSYFYQLGHFEGLPWEDLAAVFGVTYLLFYVWFAFILGVYAAGFKRWPFDRDAIERRLRTPPERREQ